MGREILHVNANLQCLDQFNTDVQNKECLREVMQDTEMDRPFSVIDSGCLA